LNWTIGDDNIAIITSDGLIGRKSEDGLPAELYNLNDVSFEYFLPTGKVLWKIEEFKNFQSLLHPDIRDKIKIPCTRINLKFPEFEDMMPWKMSAKFDGTFYYIDDEVRRSNN